jgi:superoxide dismutase, Cu-Zn family
MAQSKLLKACVVLLMTLPLAGIAAAQMEHMDMKGGITRCIAVLQPTKGNSASGIVRFEAVEGGVRVIADFSGLAPGKHGFHIHEFGDCSSDDGSSAGGHFNPNGMPHGTPASEQRHVGDLGNIEADKDGKAHLDYVDAMISFSGKNSIVGRGVIVHEKEDDLKTQPTGAAGARVACGVIGVAK